MRAKGSWIILVAVVAVLAQAGARAELRVVATTSIVGDLVRAVGGDAIDLRVLMPPDTDPHSFQPVPRDGAMLAEADVVFASGLGLEEFLEPLLESTGARGKLVEVSRDIQPRRFGDADRHDETAHDEDAAGESPAHHHESDPHVWLDPSNVSAWVRVIERELTSRDPSNGPVYAGNANLCRASLTELDDWIQSSTGEIAPSNRQLVTDHDAWGYFAARYGFTMTGNVLPGFSSLSDPSAREMAALEDTIRSLGVRAVFVGVGSDPRMAEQIAADTGIRVVPLYTGALSGPGGPAATYIDMMRHNVRQIVDVLK